jgi:hypothetical protein
VTTEFVTCLPSLYYMIHIFRNAWSQRRARQAGTRWTTRRARSCTTTSHLPRWHLQELPQRTTRPTWPSWPTWSRSTQPHHSQINSFAYSLIFRERRDPQETPARTPPPVATDSPAHPAQLDSPVPQARLERKDHLARTDPPEPRERTAHPDQPAQPDPRASADPMAPPETVEHQEDLDQLDQQAQPATTDHPATPDSPAHPAHLERMQSTALALAALSSTRSRRPKGHQSPPDLATTQLSLSTIDTLPLCMLITMVLFNSKFAIVSFVRQSPVLLE